MTTHPDSHLIIVIPFQTLLDLQWLSHKTKTDRDKVVDRLIRDARKRPRMVQ